MTLRLPRALIVDEEENLLTHDGAAERAPKLVLLKCTADRTEEISRIESIIAQELEGLSVKLIGARLRDGVYLSSTVISVLSLEVIGDDSKLFD